MIAPMDDRRRDGVTVIDRPRPAPPRLQTDTRPQPFTPRIRMFLVAGFYEPPDVLAWTLVGHDGEAAYRLEDAKLYSFDREGSAAARLAALQLRDTLCPDGIAFPARVIVTDRDGGPPEIIAAWRLENPQPVNVGPYWFDR
jgi:hypothetical protein